MKISLSLPTKLKTVLVVLLISLAPLVLFAVFTLVHARSTLSDITGVRFEESAAGLISSIDQMMYTRKEDVRQLAADPAMRSLGSVKPVAGLSKILRKWKKRYGVYSVVVLASPEGKVLASSQPSHVGQDVSNERWFKTIVERGLKQGLPYSGGWFGSASGASDVLVGGLEYDSLSSSYGINFTVPVKIGERVVGVLVSRLNWSELFEAVNALSVDQGGNIDSPFAVLLNRNGDVIGGPGFLLSGDAKANPDSLLFSSNLVPLGPLTMDLVKAAKGSKRNGAYSELTKAGEEYLVGFAPSLGHLNFRGLGWSVLVMQRMGAALAPVDAMQRNLRLVGSITLVAALVIVLLMIAASESQLSGYAGIAHAVSDGDYSKKATEGADDLGGLGPVLNQMTAAVREKVLDLRSQKHEAECVNQSKSELLAHIGHELRTPLHGIIELADVMLEASPSAEQQSCAKNIVRSATSLLSLAHNMVDINTLEQSGGQPEPVSYDLRSVIEEVAEVLSLRSAHKGVELITYYDPQCPRYFFGQAARLHQIFTNMLEHALRMTDEEQILISVHCRAVGEQEARVWILVEDAGIGLERPQVEAIWKSGESESAGMYEYKDVGLDLVVSKQIAGLIGGSMGRIGGDAGGAETAWFAITQLIDVDRAADVQQDPCKLGSARALIAVDNPVAAKLLATILTGWQAQCVLASNVDEAFQVLQDSVDTNMPFDYLVTSEKFGGDGPGFIGQLVLRNDVATLRTVYLSSLISLFDASSIGDKLPINMLTAPFAVDALKRAVEDF